MIIQKELIKFPIFSSLTEQDIFPLLSSIKTRHFKKGQIIFQEGEIGDHVYFIVKGQVKLSKLLPNGDEHIIDLCNPYDSFAEIVLLESGSYPATAEVMKDSTLFVLSNTTMSNILVENPNISLALVRTLSKRLRLAQEFIRTLTTHSIAGVLAIQLLKLANPPLHPGDPIYVDNSLTHKELANMIGTSREVVNRVINNWKKQGLLQIRNNRLEILKPHELANWP